MICQMFVDRSKDLDDIFESLESIKYQIYDLKDLARDITLNFTQQPNTTENCIKLNVINNLVLSCCNKAAMVIQALKEVLKPSRDLFKLSYPSEYEETSYQPHPEMLNFFRSLLEDLQYNLVIDKLTLEELQEVDYPKDEFYEDRGLYEYEN